MIINLIYKKKDDNGHLVGEVVLVLEKESHHTDLCTNFPQSPPQGTDRQPPEQAHTGCRDTEVYTF